MIAWAKLSRWCGLLALGAGMASAANLSAAERLHLRRVEMPRSPASCEAPSGPVPVCSAPTCAAPACAAPSCSDEVSATPGATSPLEPAGPFEPAAPTDFSSAVSGDFGGASGQESAVPNMLGDFLSSAYAPQILITDGLGNTVALFDARSPYIRTFKMAENQSPRPQDRAFFDYHYFQASSVNLQRLTTGFEKRVLDGQASFGMRLPYFISDPDTIISPFAGQVGAFGLSPSSQSAMGDLTTFFKFAPYLDRQTGDTFSLGLAVTAPTGSETMAGVTPVFRTAAEHNGSIQPYLGFVLPTRSGWFAQGFSAIDVPFSSGDTTWWFNDVAIGKYVNRGPAYWVTAVIPMLEVHVNTPIDNRTIPVTGATGSTGGLFTGNSLPPFARSASSRPTVRRT